MTEEGNCISEYEYQVKDLPLIDWRGYTTMGSSRKKK